MIKFLSIITMAIFLISCSEEKEKETNSNVSKSISFNENEVRYYEKIYYKSFGDCSNKIDCAEIKIEYPEIISYGASYDSVNNYIQSLILNLPFNEDEYKSIDELSDSLFSNYISVQKEFSEYHTGWFINCEIKISGIVNNIITIKSNNVIYTGGANTYQNIIFSNFDLRYGNIITVYDIISEKDLTLLEKIGEDIFRKLKNIPGNKSLEEAGFWFENKTFTLNDNFAITDSGLTFLYNLYEIAPRSTGITEVFIPKKKLDPFVNIYN